MRLKLEFELDNQTLTAEYRRCMLSFFKTCLADRADTIYTQGAAKNFSFAVKLPRAKFTDGTVTIPEKRIYLFFSSGDIELWLVFYNSFVKNIGLEYKLPMNNCMKLVRVYAEKEVEIKSNIILVDFVSPLCIREHSRIDNCDVYHSINSTEFLTKFKECIKAQLDGVLDLTLVNNLNIQPINAKKTIALHYGQHLEVSIGKFVITGEMEILKYLYQNGVASRKSSGFGYFNVIEQGGD